MSRTSGNPPRTATVGRAKGGGTRPVPPGGGGGSLPPRPPRARPRPRPWPPPPPTNPATTRPHEGVAGRELPPPSPAPGWALLHHHPPPRPAATPPPPSYGASGSAGGVGSGAWQGPELAEWPLRVLGGLVDYVAPSILVGIIQALVQSFILSLLVGIIPLGYAIFINIQQGETGQTPGKRLVGTKLVSEATLQPPGVGVALGRYFITIVGVVTYCIANLIDALFPCGTRRSSGWWTRCSRRSSSSSPSRTSASHRPPRAHTSTGETAPSRRRRLRVRVYFSAAATSVTSTCGTAPTAGCART